MAFSMRVSIDAARFSDELLFREHRWDTGFYRVKRDVAMFAACLFDDTFSAIRGRIATRFRLRFRWKISRKSLPGPPQIDRKSTKTGTKKQHAFRRRPGGDFGAFRNRKRCQKSSKIDPESTPGAKKPHFGECGESYAPASQNKGSGF